MRELCCILLCKFICLICYVVVIKICVSIFKKKSGKYFKFFFLKNFIILEKIRNNVWCMYFVVFFKKEFINNKSIIFNYKKEMIGELKVDDLNK